MGLVISEKKDYAKEHIAGFVKFYYDRNKSTYSYETSVSCSSKRLEENKNLYNSSKI